MAHEERRCPGCCQFVATTAGIFVFHYADDHVCSFSSTHGEQYPSREEWELTGKRTDAVKDVCPYCKRYIFVDLCGRIIPHRSLYSVMDCFGSRQFPAVAIGTTGKVPGPSGADFFLPQRRDNVAITGLPAADAEKADRVSIFSDPPEQDRIDCNNMQESFKDPQESLKKARELILQRKQSEDKKETLTGQATVTANGDHEHRSDPRQSPSLLEGMKMTLHFSKPEHKVPALSKHWVVRRGDEHALCGHEIRCADVGQVNVYFKIAPDGPLATLENAAEYLRIQGLDGADQCEFCVNLVLQRLCSAQDCYGMLRIEQATPTPSEDKKETIAEWANRAREQLDRLHSFDKLYAAELQKSVSACTDFLKLNDHERAALDHETHKAHEEQFGVRDGRTITVIVYNYIDNTAEVRAIYHMETDFVGMSVVAVIGGDLCRERCKWCSNLDVRVKACTLQLRSRR